MQHMQHNNRKNLTKKHRISAVCSHFLIYQLSKTRQISPAGSLTSSARALTLNPQTGDDHSVLIWGVVTAIAAAAVIVLIVIIIKRRK